MASDKSDTSTPVDPATPPATDTARPDNRDTRQPDNRGNRDTRQPDNRGNRDTRQPDNRGNREEPQAPASARTAAATIETGHPLRRLINDPTQFVVVEGGTGDLVSLEVARPRPATPEPVQPPAAPPTILVIPEREPAPEEPKKAFRGFVELASPTGRQFLEVATDDNMVAKAWFAGMTDARVDRAEQVLVEEARERANAAAPRGIDEIVVRERENMARRDGETTGARRRNTLWVIALAVAGGLLAAGLLGWWANGCSRHDDAPAVAVAVPTCVVGVCTPTCPCPAPAPAPNTVHAVPFPGGAVLVNSDGSAPAVVSNGSKGDKGDQGDPGRNGRNGKDAPAPAPEPAPAPAPEPAPQGPSDVRDAHVR